MKGLHSAASAVGISRRRTRRYLLAVVLALGTALAGGMSHARAQQAGANVNVLPAYPIGNTFPPSPITSTTKADALKGDNYLQRQNEPVVASSTYNPDHLFSAFNDFRSVDFANDTGLPGNAAQGWIGYSRSYDRGKHWYGAMVPGFPGGTSAADLSSPLHGLAAGSDPTLATTPGGHFYLGGLFFTPGGVSNIAVMHLRDVPSLDGGDSIQPGKITIVDKGSQSDTGNFEDKPGIAADIARGTIDPSVCGPVYMAYTIFVGGADTTPFTSKIGFTRSKQGKCGEAWDNDQYLNKNYKQNQGTAIAVDPGTGKIYVVWRHVFVAGGDGFPDSILMATSTDFGTTFSAPVPITGTDFAPYDQISISSTSDPNHVTFRSNAFPAITVDGFGNAYVTVQEKVSFGPPMPPGYNEPRITIRALRAGAAAWTKSLIETSFFVGGQQMMPSVTFSAGVLKAMWYDFRRPESFPNDPAWGRPSDCDSAGHCYITGLDRRMETRLAQSPVAATGALSFAASTPVTKYNAKLLAGLPAVNRPNLPMFVGGTTAFTGDYITVMSGSPFVANPKGSNPPFRWASQATDYPALSSLTAWADSRDVVFPIGGSGQPELSVANIQAWQSYGPPGTGLASCTNPGSRNQNVYFSEVKAGVIAGSPATSRQLVDGSGHAFERAFPFYVQNTTLRQKLFRLTFQQDSTAVKGSFVQGTASAIASPPFVDVAINPISTVSKTIYTYCASCTATSAFARFSIKVDEIDQFGSVVSGGLTTLLRFNSDPTAPFVTNPNLANQEIHTVSFSTADWANADWANADWANADWANADWANADWANADWANADWANADWANADWANADWANADWANTSPVGDLVTTAANVGNNSSSYSVSVNIDPATAKALRDAGYLAGVIITRSYNKPNSFTGCAIQPIPLEQIISVIPLDLTNPQATVLDTAGFSAVPAVATTLAAGSSSGAAEIQPDKVFIVLRLFGHRPNGPTGPAAAPLTTQQQASIVAAATTTVTPQAGPTVAGKTTATVTLSNLNQIYNGSPLTPTATTNPPGLTVIFTGAPQTNVGTYAVLATISNPTYQGSTTGTFIISKAAVTATAGSGSAIYDGSAKSPSACAVTGTYKGDLSCANNPSSVGPGAGTTTITPVVSGTGLGNFNITTVNGSYSISQAGSTTTVTCPASVTYNGAAQTPCTASVTGAGGLSQSLTPTYTNNINAGTATASASYAGDANHTGSSDSKTFAIAKAPVTATAGSGSSIYDGSAKSPSACAVTGAYTGDLSCANNPPSVGPGAGTTSITPVVSGTGLGNFDITTVNGSFVIGKANASCTVTGYSVTYDGNPHTATGSCTGVGSDGTLSGLNLNGTTHTAAGDYPADPWTFTDVSGNYNNASGTVHDTITGFTGTILIYGPALASGITPNEATLASDAGYTVVTKTAVEWSALSPTDFASFNAVVFPDPNCAASPSPTLDTAVATRTTWSPAVTGRKVVVGTDPLFHSNFGRIAARTLMLNGITFAASGPTTGMYMSLSCYYSDELAPAAAVTVLDQFGSFQVTGWDRDQVNIVDPTHPVMAGLTDATLSNWGNSVHEWFSSFPATWKALATETSSGIKPYIIVSNGTLLVYGPALAGGITPNEATLASDAGYTVVTKTAAEWSALSTAGFASFNAIVFPDPNCATSPSPTLDTAVATRTTWSPAVTGRKVVVGTDPLFHSNFGRIAARTLMLNGITFAASGPTTGMYMSLSCYYSDELAPAAAVTVLDQFGSFQVTGWDRDQVNIVDPAHPVMAGLTDATLSNWGNSVHEWFSSFPSTWRAVASETTSGVKPYIITDK